MRSTVWGPSQTLSRCHPLATDTPAILSGDLSQLSTWRDLTPHPRPPLREFAVSSSPSLGPPDPQRQGLQPFLPSPPLGPQRPHPVLPHHILRQPGPLPGTTHPRIAGCQLLRPPRVLAAPDDPPGAPAPPRAISGEPAGGPRGSEGDREAPGRRLKSSGEAAGKGRVSEGPGPGAGGSRKRREAGGLEGGGGGEPGGRAAPGAGRGGGERTSPSVTAPMACAAAAAAAARAEAAVGGGGGQAPPQCSRVNSHGGGGGGARGRRSAA